MAAPPSWDRGTELDTDHAAFDRLSAGALVLHLAPGAAILVAFVVIAAVLPDPEVPPQLALLIAFLAVGVPLDFGYLRRRQRRSHATGLRDVIFYLRPVPQA